jgi:hypothetical protein
MSKDVVEAGAQGQSIVGEFRYAQVAKEAKGVHVDVRQVVVF